MAVTCATCHSAPPAICASCVRKRFAQHRTAQSTLTASVDRHTKKAAEALAGDGGLTKTRDVEAGIALKEWRLQAVREESTRLEAKIAQNRSRLSALLDTLAARRSTLADLQAAPPALRTRTLLDLQLRSSPPYTSSLLQTRQVLLSELLQVFDVRVYADDSDEDDEDDGFFKRNPGEDEEEDQDGGERARRGGRGEWVIGNGLILPSAGDIHLFPPEQTNAAFKHTLHLLSLFATYLSPPLGLPFIPFLRPASLLPSPQFHPSPLATTPDLAALLSKYSPRGVFPLSVPQRHPELLLAALAALQYDVCYLAAHVGVVIPLHEAGDVLFGLYRIALELGSARGTEASHRAMEGAAAPPVSPVSLERIVLSLRGTFAPAPGASAAGKKEDQRRQEKEAKRRAKDALKASETPEERDERRRRRRIRRAEKEKREREREEWEVVGDSLESIRREAPR